MSAKTSEKYISWIVAAILFLLYLGLYVSRMAPSVVAGDPGEYQIVASGWGIGHPPGYGFYALLGNLFTHLIPIGTFAWRANLLSAACGATIVGLAYGMGRTLSAQLATSLRGQAPPILGAAILGSGIDLWQHAIHANAHILTALLATWSLFCLLRWWRTGRERWLFLFCLVAGMSPVLHPLLVLAFPAYALFVLAVRPRVLREGRTLLKMLGVALLGAMTYLYYPIRCAIGAPPLPGPSDMHTWAGFVRVVTAQGLRVNLVRFSLRDVLYRLWDVRVPLGLQYTPAALALAGVGLVGLWVRHRRPALLLTGYVVCVVLATINILQDAMAYLLGPVVTVGVLIGFGVDVLLGWAGWVAGPHPPAPSPKPGRGGAQWRALASYGLVGLVVVLPLWAAAVNWTRMDLHDLDDADGWLAAVEARFGGQGERAVLLTEWERMTTVYYYQEIEGRSWDEANVRFVPISAGTRTPFLNAIDAYLPSGPVYLTTYRPNVVSKVRLMPSGTLWQALPAWPRELPAGARPAHVVAEGSLEIVGWQIDRERAQVGDVLNLDLYMRMPDPEGAEAQQYYLPWARLGETTYRFTTDSRFNTPWWQAGEIVVERFELPVPWKMRAGNYPLQVGVRWINEGRDLALQDGGTLATLAEIEVEPAPWRPADRKLDGALGNFGGQMLLRGARVNGQRVPTEGPLAVRPGRPLRVVLAWESLRPIEENYTAFVQVLDAAFQVRAQRDTPPLGGSAPTLLWFPRWRRGTRIADTYVLDLPADLPAGQYPLVVGMYGFATRKRVQVASPDGDVDGDWVALAHLQINSTSVGW